MFRAIFLLLALSLTVNAKVLSKEEIRSIIIKASKHSKHYKKSYTKKVNRDTKNTKTKTVIVKKKPTKKETVKPQKIVKKLLPFVPLPDYNNKGMVINQKGFRLIKGEPKKEPIVIVNKNPLYKL